MSGIHDEHDLDPRPVFDGDWSKADGHARQAHMTLIAAWKARQPEGSAQRQRAKGSAAQAKAQSHDEERVAHLQTLQTIIDEPKALSSDRIRAVEARERILAKQAEEQAAETHGPLVALGEALRALPIDQRVGALDGLLGVEG